MGANTSISNCVLLQKLHVEALVLSFNRVEFAYEYCTSSSRTNTSQSHEYETFSRTTS